MTLLGSYDNENFSLLNILDVNDNNNLQVKTHETIHMLLSLQTKWGCIEYYFNHIGLLIDSQYLFISHILHKSCEVVQESLAEFWEKLYVYLKNGENEFIQSIKDDRWKAPNTYKYLKKILDIIKVKKELSIENIAFCLYRIALHSMNIEITDFSKEKWWNGNSNCDIDIFGKHDIPNHIYENMIDKFINALQSEDLYDYLDSIENEWSIADEESRQKQLKVILNYIKDVCSESKYYKEIENYLSTIKCKTIDIESLDEYIIPNTFTQYKKGIGFKGYTQAAIIFIFGDSKDAQETLKYKLWREDIQNYFNLIGEKIMVEYMYYIDKEIRCDLISNSKLQKYLRRYNFVRVISYKAYENNSKLVRQLEYGKCRYYIYCDRPYWSAKQTIESNCSEKKWVIVNFENFAVICLAVSRFGILFVPVCSASNFYLDLDKYYSGKKMFMKDMFKKISDMDEFNLVINCLFNV